jgi:acetyltransferase
MGGLLCRFLVISLDPIFKPRSVAVVGASATPGTVGSILIHNLLTNPFGGVVYPVNPKRHQVHGVRCYPDLNSLPEIPDLVLIATPAAVVPDLIAQCVACKIPAGIIISAGFSELGPRANRWNSEFVISAGQNAINRPELSRRHSSPQ